MESHRNLTKVHQNLLGAQSLTKQVQQQLNEAQRVERFWQRLDSHYQNGLPAAALLVLSGEYQNVRATTLFDQEQSGLIEEIRSECQKAADQTAKTFVRAFPEAVNDAGIDVDSSSRHPKYSLKQDFITIEVNDRNYTATITPRDGKAIKLGLDIEPVVKTLEAEIARLFDRKFEANTFLQTLFKAYSGVIRAEGRTDGETVPIRRVTNRLSKNLNNFSYDQFNVDFGKLLGMGQQEFKGRKMQIENTRTPREGMLIHGRENGGYIGFIGFHEGENRE
jgi:hypothetical protein